MASRAPTQTRPQWQTGSSIHQIERPWLLPTNRRIRNLVSISLRNLALTPSSPSRPRGKTIDDDALPNTLVSPAKLFALREQRTLEHSHSSSDLRSLSENAAAVSDTELSGTVNGSPGKTLRNSNGSLRAPQRPSLARMKRRRSTLDWSSATPQRRQERLESLTTDRMADVFFSLHVEGVKEPVYVSEVVERTMNPTFRHIDLSACGPGITRMDHLTIRFWVHSSRRQNWQHLLEVAVDLTKLQYLGRNLDGLLHALPQNSAVFHFTDGVYAAFQSLSDYIPPHSTPLARASSTRTLPTASFDALLRLAKLDDSIEDALVVRDHIASDLEMLLEQNKAALIERDQVSEAEDRLKTIDYAKKTVEKQLDKARKQHAEKREVLNKRRELMQSDATNRAAQAALVEQRGPEASMGHDDKAVKTRVIQNQRRRICEDLQKIFPIQPISGNLNFAIRGLRLPDSDNLEDEPPDQVAAALDYVAHAVLLLAFYFSRPLPYPVSPHGSNTTIEDPISLLKTNASTTQVYKDDKALRTYPLFSKGVPRFRFEYGVFLLNKNIQILLENEYGIRVLDIRQTLGNLKYLLYVATAGEGELPARKAGGIRGLLRNKIEDIPQLSRKGSEDSTASLFSGSTLHDGKAKQADHRLRAIIDGKSKHG